MLREKVGRIKLGSKDCLLVGLLSGYDGLTMKEVEVVWEQEMFKEGSLGFSDAGTWSRPLTK